MEKVQKEENGRQKTKNMLKEKMGGSCKRRYERAPISDYSVILQTVFT